MFPYYLYIRPFSRVIGLIGVSVSFIGYSARFERSNWNWIRLLKHRVTSVANWLGVMYDVGGLEIRTYLLRCGTTSHWTVNFRTRSCLKARGAMRFSNTTLMPSATVLEGGGSCTKTFSSCLQILPRALARPMVCRLPHSPLSSNVTESDGGYKLENPDSWPATVI